jgi:hypothetical protein
MTQDRVEGIWQNSRDSDMRDLTDHNLPVNLPCVGVAPKACVFSGHFGRTVMS